VGQSESLPIKIPICGLSEIELMRGSLAEAGLNVIIPKIAQTPTRPKNFPFAIDHEREF
jgi:hypothetical protein